MCLLLVYLPDLILHAHPLPLDGTPPQFNITSPSRDTHQTLGLDSSVGEQNAEMRLHNMLKRGRYRELVRFGSSPRFRTGCACASKSQH